MPDMITPSPTGTKILSGIFPSDEKNKSNPADFFPSIGKGM